MKINNMASQRVIKDGGGMLTVRARYLRISAQKLNLIAKVIRGEHLESAITKVAFLPNKGAKLIGKLLKSGRAAALEKGLKVSSLSVDKLLVGQGPSLKRGRPVARGSYHQIRKKMSHLVLVLKEV